MKRVWIERIIDEIDKHETIDFHEKIVDIFTLSSDFSPLETIIVLEARAN